jgi:hypothetical protein
VPRSSDPRFNVNLHIDVMGLGQLEPQGRFPAPIGIAELEMAPRRRRRVRDVPEKSRNSAKDDGGARKTCRGRREYFAQQLVG